MERVREIRYRSGPRIGEIGKDAHKSNDVPRAWLNKGTHNFSFSGLKSSVINHNHNKKQKQEKIITEDIAASFQASVVEVLTEKTYKAATEYNVKQVIVAGGVAANSGLRESLEARFENNHIPLFIPPLYLC